MTKQIYFSKYPRLVFSLTIFLLLAACGGGGGSSGGGIGAQGLWIQRSSTCGCAQLDASAGTPTRCFFYFQGGSAVSGYLSPTLSRCGSTYQARSGDTTNILSEARQVTVNNRLIGTYIAAARGTVFDVGAATRTGARNINFIYSGPAAELPGRSRVCSIYIPVNDREIDLGLGRAGDRRQVSTAEACNNNRYTTPDRYIKP